MKKKPVKKNNKRAAKVGDRLLGKEAKKEARLADHTGTIRRKIHPSREIRIEGAKRQATVPRRPAPLSELFMHSTVLIGVSSG